MTVDEEHLRQDEASERRALTWIWMRFAAMCLACWIIGWMLRVGAGLSGGHDGRPMYITGAVLSAGPLALRAIFTKLPPLRVTAAVLAVLTGAFWLVGLHDFLASPGLQW